MATSRRVIVHLKDLSQCNEGVVMFSIYSGKPIENLAPTGDLNIKQSALTNNILSMLSGR